MLRRILRWICPDKALHVGLKRPTDPVFPGSDITLAEYRRRLNEGTSPRCIP